MSFYDDASWLLIPSGIEEDIVFAQKPTSGLGDLTFTRASDATYTDASGVVRRSPYNLVQDSEMFSTANWLKTNETIGINTAVAPNGTLTADKLIPTTTNGLHICESSLVSFFAGNSYTFSFYAKRSESSFIQFTASSSLLAIRANYNLLNGTLGTVDSGIVATITSAGDGWYRCTASFTASVTGSYRAIICSITSATSVRFNSFSGDGTSGVFIWGAQLVEGSSALDYFPTTNRQDVPRIDFRNADGTLSSCGRLLLEPQRTNLVPNGLAYQAATGVLYNTAVSGSPMAGVNCARITKNEAAGTLRYANQQCSSSVLAGSTGYVLSAFFKYDGVDVSTTMEFNNSADFGGIAWRQFINIASTGITLGTSTSCTSTIENWGSGWYRVNVRITTGAAPSGSLITYLMRLPSTLSTGQGFLHALPQFELGAYQTTYIPTTTAAVTRLADTASKTGVSSLIGQTEGTLFAEVNLEYLNFAQYRNCISVTDGTFNNAAIIFINNSNSNSNQFAFNFRDGGLTVASILASNLSIANIGSTYKIAAAYKANDFVFYINGVQIGADTSGSISGTLSRIDLGSIGFTGLSTIDRQSVSQSIVFPTRLTNAQLAQLTTL